MIAAMLAAALRLLTYYNGNEKSAENPGGLTGTGGMADNWDACIQDIGIIANGVGDVATIIGASQSTLATSWDTGTADANPGAAKTRASTAALTAGSYTLYASTTDAAGGDATAVLTGYGASTSATKGRLRLVKIGDPTKYVDLDVTGVTVASGYRKVAVTYVAGPGGFVAADPVALGFVRTGDIGLTGPAPTLATTSTTSLTIGTGAKTLTTAAALNLGVGANLTISNAADATNYMYGAITAIAGTSVTVNVTRTGGGGTVASWTVTGGGTGPAGTDGVNGSGPVWYGISAGTANAQTLSGALANLTGHPSVEFVAGASNGAVTRTNLLPNATDLSAWTKVGTGSVTTNARVDRYGVATMDLLSDTDATTDNAYWQEAVTVANDSSAYTAAVDLAQGTAAVSRLVLFLTGGGTPIASGAQYAEVNWSTLTVSGIAGAKLEAVGAGLYRLIAPITNNGTGNTTLITRLYPAGPAASATGTVYAGHAQLETGTKATPPIVTGATAVSVTDGHMTLTVGSTAETALLDAAGRALAPGAVTYGSKYVATYDGTYWRLAGGGLSAVSMPVVAKSGAYTVAVTDAGKLLACTGTWALSLLSAAAGNGFTVAVANVSSGQITIDPNGAETINGAPAIVLLAGESVLCVSDGTGWTTIGVYSKLVEYWNPSDKNAAITLTNNNLTASTTTLTKAVRALVAFPLSRSYYCEIVLDSAAIGGVVGLAKSTATLADYLGSDANGYGYSANGNILNNGAAVTTGSSYTAGDVIGIYYDPVAGKAWFAKNGVIQGGGNPATGASPTLSGLSGTFYPAWSSGNSGTGTSQATARFAAASWVYNSYGFSPIS